MELFANEDVTVQVLQMKGAKDPDEFIKKFGAEKFEMLISGASSALDFTLSKLKNQYDISNTEQRVQYLTKACDVLAELHNPIRQDVYSRRLAQETATDKSAILEMISRKARSLRRKEDKKREREILNSGVGAKIKVDYRQKGNTMPKVYAQQQIICGIVKDNTLYPTIAQRLKPENFTDTAMRNAYREIEKMMAENLPVTYSSLAYRLSDEDGGVLPGIFARNADNSPTVKDMERFADDLLTAKLTRAEAGERTVDDLAQRFAALREKKK